jgi:3-deoxy-7-phosphoheptulonate synthase
MFLEERRKLVDKIDRKIIELIIERNKLTEEIIEYKKNNNLDIIDVERENEIINKLKDKYCEKIKIEQIEKIYSEILFFSKYNYISNNLNSELNQIFSSKPLLIAGPCSIESEEQIFRIAKDLSEMGIKYLRGGAFKPRTSPDTFQGLGEKGLLYIYQAARKYGMRVVTEITSREQFVEYSELVDIIQIGSRNMFSYQFLKDIGKLNSKINKPIILKRHFAATLNEFLNAAEYLKKSGSENIILCLRGIRTFEQIDSKMRNTPDLASILELKNRTDLPVIFDPSHSTGKSEFVISISKAALALGTDGLIIETHFDPKNSIVDSEQTIDYFQLKIILSFIEQIKYAK